MEQPKHISNAQLLMAISTAHDTCAKAGDCVHAAAMDGIQPEVSKAILHNLTTALSMGIDPMLATFFFGLHVGYQLKQIMSEETVNASIN